MRSVRAARRRRRRYRRALTHLVEAEGLTEFPPRDALILLAEHGPLTTRELAEVHEQPAKTMQTTMETLAAEGWVEKLPARGGEFWALTAPNRGTIR